MHRMEALGAPLAFMRCIEGDDYKCAIDRSNSILADKKIREQAILAGIDIPSLADAAYGFPVENPETVFN